LPENRLVCITTDNGSNMIAAVEILKYNCLACFVGHNLHLAITNFMKDDDRVACAIGVAHKIINTFAHSWKKEKVMKVQIEMDLPHHSLVTKCTTRWVHVAKFCIEY